MKLYGLIGKSLTHSFSKKYFTEKFKTLELEDHGYELFPISSIEDLLVLIKENPSLRGLNVTIPYKTEVIPYLSALNDEAEKVGAVNTIKIIGADSSKKLIGYNTDVYGFRQSIKPFLEGHHEKALILGNGGASKAVAYTLTQFGIKCFFVGRNKTEGINFTYEELTDNIIKACKLIINCTPVGTFPNINDAPDLPYEAITTDHLCYDLVYNPEETEFIKRSKALGAQTVNGLSMLHLQAEKAWEIWSAGGNDV